MEKQHKPLIRVTLLEAYRRYINDALFSSEQGLIDSITGTFQGNEYTRVGTAFHSIVELGQQKLDIAPKSSRTYLYRGQEVKEEIPEGYKFNIDGYDVCMDYNQYDVALDYRNEHPQAFHEIRTSKDYGNAIVTGCTDMIDGTELRDIKTKYSPVNDSDYMDSAQWRFYLDLFGGDTFHFDLFCFNGYDKVKHGYDVRGLELTRHAPITCYRYDRMSQDNRELLDSFLEWAKYRNVIKYLIK